MIGVIEHVVDRWKAELPGCSAVCSRNRRCANGCTPSWSFASEGGVTQGEFTVFATAVRRPLLAAPWLAYLKTWFGFDEADDPPRSRCAPPPCPGDASRHRLPDLGHFRRRPHHNWCSGLARVGDHNLDPRRSLRAPQIHSR